MLKTTHHDIDTVLISVCKYPPAVLLSQPSPVAKLVLAEVHDE
jgi:hypothetical protein